MKGIDYHDRFFAPVSNTGNGEVGSSNIFHYRQAEGSSGRRTKGVTRIGGGNTAESVKSVESLFRFAA